MPSDNRPRGSEHYRYKHGGKGERLYNIWCKMRKRCNSPSDPAYERYGGRGISVCPAWDDYGAFRDWALANGYADSLTIDRFPDSSGDYAPNNCRWATYAEQNRNYSRNRPIKFRGQEVLVCDLAIEVGLPQDILNNRIFRYGWTVEEAITTPVMRKGGRR